MHMSPKFEGELFLRSHAAVYVDEHEGEALAAGTAHPVSGSH